MTPRDLGNPLGSSRQRPWLSLVLGLLLVTTVLTLALPGQATHNSVGVRMAVGDTDPGPSTEPDVDDALRPLYHAQSDGEELAFRGDAPRPSPADQTGLGMGSWIGLLDGVLEAHGQGVSTCIVVIREICNRPDDPLYRANPASGDEECDDLDERADPAACDGESHRLLVDLWPLVRVQPHQADALGGPGSGFLYPGTYSLHVYLLGDGTGGVSAGQGALDHLAPDACAQATGLEACQLITPTDLLDHTQATSAADVSQVAAVCFYSPGLHVLSEGDRSSGCPANGAVDLFVPATEGSLYVTNQPGWYAQTMLVEPTGGLQPSPDRTTLTGERTDLARVLHTYVNPVPPTPDLWCIAPPVATSAPDQIGVNMDHDYLVEGHDLDVYTSDLPYLGLEPDRLLAQADALVETLVTSLPPELTEILEPVRQEAETTASRFVPTQPHAAEPNTPDAREQSLALVTEASVGRCQASLGLTDGEQERLVANLVDARLVQRAATGLVTFAQVHASERAISGPYHLETHSTPEAASAPLKDPTVTDATGLPAPAGETTAGAWHPSSWTFEGELNIFADADGDGAFTGCPSPGEPTSPEAPDLCAARLNWDAYNPRACMDAACLETVGQRAQSLGYTDPLGLISVVRTSGHTVVQHQHTLETWELVNGGPTAMHCIVGANEGLLAPGSPQADRIHTLFEATETTDEALLDAICGEVSGETLLVRDAFGTQTAPGTFGALFTWSSTGVSANAIDPVAGDELVLHAVLTTERVTDDTASTLRLGHTDTTTTLEHVWPDGDQSYVWRDVDPFAPSAP